MSEQLENVLFELFYPTNLESFVCPTEIIYKFIDDIYGILTFSKIVYQLKGGIERHVDILMKKAHKDESLRRVVPYRRLHEREVFVHTNVGPIFSNILENLAIDKLHPFMNYVGSTVKPVETVGFKKFDPLGRPYKNPEMPHALDYQRLLLVCDKYALIHAMSFYIKETDRKLFDKLANNLQDLELDEHLGLVQKDGDEIQRSLDCFHPVQEAEDLQKYKNVVKDFDKLQPLISALKMNDNSNVLTHCDTNMLNYIFHDRLFSATTGRTIYKSYYDNSIPPGNLGVPTTKENVSDGESSSNDEEIEDVTSSETDQLPVQAAEVPENPTASTTHLELAAKAPQEKLCLIEEEGGSIQQRTVENVESNLTEQPVDEVEADIEVGVEVSETSFSSSKGREASCEDDAAIDVVICEEESESLTTEKTVEDVQADSSKETDDVCFEEHIVQHETVETQPNLGVENFLKKDESVSSTASDKTKFLEEENDETVNKMDTSQSNGDSQHDEDQHESSNVTNEDGVVEEPFCGEVSVTKDEASAIPCPSGRSITTHETSTEITESYDDFEDASTLVEEPVLSSSQKKYYLPSYSLAIRRQRSESISIFDNDDKPTEETTGLSPIESPESHDDFEDASTHVQEPELSSSEKKYDLPSHNLGAIRKRSESVSIFDKDDKPTEETTESAPIETTESYDDFEDASTHVQEPELSSSEKKYDLLSHNLGAIQKRSESISIFDKDDKPTEEITEPAPIETTESYDDFEDATTLGEEPELSSSEKKYDLLSHNLGAIQKGSESISIFDKDDKPTEEITEPAPVETTESYDDFEDASTLGEEPELSSSQKKWLDLEAIRKRSEKIAEPLILELDSSSENDQQEQINIPILKSAEVTESYDDSKDSSTSLKEPKAGSSQEKYLATLDLLSNDNDDKPTEGTSEPAISELEPPSQNVQLGQSNPLSPSNSAEVTTSFNEPETSGNQKEFHSPLFDIEPQPERSETTSTFNNDGQPTEDTSEPAILELDPPSENVQPGQSKLPLSANSDEVVELYDNLKRFMASISEPEPSGIQKTYCSPMFNLTFVNRDRPTEDTSRPAILELNSSSQNAQPEQSSRQTSAILEEMADESPSVSRGAVKKVKTIHQLRKKQKIKFDEEFGISGDWNVGVIGRSPLEEERVNQQRQPHREAPPPPNTDDSTINKAEETEDGKVDEITEFFCEDDLISNHSVSSDSREREQQLVKMAYVWHYPESFYDAFTIPIPVTQPEKEKEEEETEGTLYRWDVLMANWQFARIGCPAMDIVPLLWCCTEKRVRNAFFERDPYYKSLKKYMSMLNVPIEKYYPLNQHKRDMMNYSTFGLYKAVTTLHQGTEVLCTRRGEYINLNEGYYRKRMKEVIRDYLRYYLGRLPSPLL